MSLSVSEAIARRPGRGAPVLSDRIRDAGMEAVAGRVAATWHEIRGPYGKTGRLSYCLIKHARDLIALFGSGTHVARFARVLAGLGVTADNGRPLTEAGVSIRWLRLERSLLARMGSRQFGKEVSA